MVGNPCSHTNFSTGFCISDIFVVKKVDYPTFPPRKEKAMRMTHTLATSIIFGILLLAIRLGPSLVFTRSIHASEEDVSDFKATIRILAMGDSLTEGYTADGGRGAALHPYTVKLKEMLKEEIAKSTRTEADVELEVVNRGVSGEITDEM